MHRIVCLTLTGVCVLASAAPMNAQSAAAAATTATTVSAEARIANLEKQLAQLRSELAAQKAGSSGSANAQLAEVERKIEILSAEIEKLKVGEATEPSGDATTPRADTRYGVGTAAAKVYGVKRGVSIGGYGEALYENTSEHDESGAPSGALDQIDFLRAVAYLGYKFDDHWVLNTEIEYEHAVAAADAGGEVALEFAYLDYMNSDVVNARAGLVLLPVGLVNELHEPTVQLSARRPDVERVILPTTWRELGAGVYGNNGIIAWRGYLTSSLDAAGFTADEGIREGRQEGSEAIAEDFALTGRLDYVGTTGLLVGVSAFAGDSGQGGVTPSGQSVNGRTSVVDFHADWQWRGLRLRGLYAQTSISQAGLINELNGFAGDQSVGSRQNGWYVQGAYDVLSFAPKSRMSLLPYLRYEQFDTQSEVPSGYARNPANDIDELTIGIAFKPIDRLIFKLDWQQRQNAARTGVDAWNVALGYIF